MALVDRAAVKEQMKIESAQYDTALDAYIAAVDGIVEDHTGHLVTSQTLSETLVLCDYVNTFVLPSKPLTGVTSITPQGGTAYDLTDMVVRSSGVVVLPFRIFGVVDVEYVAGFANPPAKYKQAALIIMQHLWSNRRRPIAQQGSALPDSMEPRGVGYAIPNAALELLGRRAPAVA